LASCLTRDRRVQCTEDFLFDRVTSCFSCAVARGRFALSLTFTLSIMIVIPGDSPPLRKGDDPTQQHISPTRPESSGPPPPPYTNHPTPSQPQYVVTAVVAETREPALRRFVRAFLVAVSIWVLAGIFVSSAVERHRSTHWVSSIPRHWGRFVVVHTQNIV
jgi:hypothetical protein